MIIWGRHLKIINKRYSMKRIYKVLIFSIASIFLFTNGFSGPSKYEGKIVKKIDYKGLYNTNPEDLNEKIKTTVGYPLRSFEIREDLKEMFKIGDFKSIDVEIEEFREGVRIRFVLIERPVVKEIEFKGFDELLETDLRDSIYIKENEVLKKELVERSIKLLKSKYDTEGLFNAVITYKIIDIDDDKLSVKVIFTIDEGEEIKVEKLAILGAKKIHSNDIIAQMETKEEGFIEKGTFDRSIYEQDKSKIIAYYKSQGYLDAQIIDDSVEYEWEDPVEKKTRVIYITIKVSEGEKYYFDKYNVSIRSKNGKTVFKPKDFMNNFELNKSGDVFDNIKFQMDRQMIGFRYAEKGYIFARVIPRKTVEEREVTADGKKEKRKFVSVDFIVNEGNKAYLETIIIKGNQKTKDYVIRREVLIKEGELFDSKKMQLTREKIYNLGFFKQVNIDVRPGSREGQMNLIVDVEEQPTGTISLGGGYGTASGFSIFADVAENNLFGRGQRVGCKFEYGPTTTSVTLSFSERWFNNWPVGFNASIFYHMYSYESEKLFTNSDLKGHYQQQVFGYSLGFSYRFLYYYVAGTSFSHSFKKYLNASGNVADTVYEQVNRPLQQKRTWTLYSFRDSKDNYLNPTRGTRLGLSMGFTGGILGGQDHYVRMSPEFSLFYSPFHIPFLKTHPCVFEIRANGTFTLPPMGSPGTDRSNENWLEYADRLRIGGPETLRGYDYYYDSALPESWQDVGLFHRVLYGLEFRFPIHPQMLWMAFFFDAGSLWSDKYWAKHLSSENQSEINKDLASGDLKNIDDFFSSGFMSYFKYSYGFGFRIQIPMMPLRFWFGKKMIYDNGFKNVGGLTFQFGIGDMRF